MTRKIALIGSAPSSVQLAPFADPTWEIWGCSPGAYPHVRRANRWFEIHRWEPGKPWFSNEYIGFMANVGRSGAPVYMIEPVPEIPSSVAYPVRAMLDEFGPFFFTSSLSWMFALAIIEGATEIGLWGVDMSAQEEWAFQRSGCHFFVHEARKRGIKVTVPPESDLLRPPPLYGFHEANPMAVKMLVRETELKARIAAAEQTLANANAEKLFLSGALDDLKYMRATWIADDHALALAYAETPPPVVAEQTKILLKADETSPGVVYEADLTGVNIEVSGDGPPVVKRKPRKPRKGRARA